MRREAMFRVMVTAALMFTLMGCEEEKVIDYRTTYDSEQEATPQQPAPEPAPSSTSESGTVYICTGDNAKSYHYDRYCEALSNCKAEIIEIYRSETGSRDREDPCNRCVVE